MESLLLGGPSQGQGPALPYNRASLLWSHHGGPGEGAGGAHSIARTMSGFESLMTSDSMSEDCEFGEGGANQPHHRRSISLAKQVLAEATHSYSLPPTPTGYSNKAGCRNHGALGHLVAMLQAAASGGVFVFAEQQWQCQLQHGAHSASAQSIAPPLHDPLQLYDRPTPQPIMRTMQPASQLSHAHSSPCASCCLDDAAFLASGGSSSGTGSSSSNQQHHRAPSQRSSFCGAADHETKLRGTLSTLSFLIMDASNRATAMDLKVADALLAILQRTLSQRSPHVARATGVMVAALEALQALFKGASAKDKLAFWRNPNSHVLLELTRHGLPPQLVVTSLRTCRQLGFVTSPELSILELGIIQAAAQLLHPSVDTAVLLKALRVLNYAAGAPCVADAPTQWTPVLFRLVPLLKSPERAGNPEVLKSVLSILLALSEHAPLRNACYAAGCVTPLLAMVTCGSCDAAMTAVSVLSTLSEGGLCRDVLCEPAALSAMLRVLSGHQCVEVTIGVLYMLGRLVHHRAEVASYLRHSNAARLLLQLLQQVSYDEDATLGVLQLLDVLGTAPLGLAAAADVPAGQSGSASAAAVATDAGSRTCRGGSMPLAPSHEEQRMLAAELAASCAVTSSRDVQPGRHRLSLGAAPHHSEEDGEDSAVVALLPPGVPGTSAAADETGEARRLCSGSSFAFVAPAAVAQACPKRSDGRSPGALTHDGIDGVDGAAETVLGTSKPDAPSRSATGGSDATTTLGHGSRSSGLMSSEPSTPGSDSSDYAGSGYASRSASPQLRQAPVVHGERPCCSGCHGGQPHRHGGQDGAAVAPGTPDRTSGGSRRAMEEADLVLQQRQAVSAVLSRPGSSASLKDLCLMHRSASHSSIFESSAVGGAAVAAC